MVMTNTNNKKDPQKKHPLGTVNKKITGGLSTSFMVPTSSLILMWIKIHRICLFTHLFSLITRRQEFDESLHCRRTFLSPRFFKKASGILQSPPSVHPSVRHTISSYTIGRNLTKFVVCVAHMNGASNGTFFFVPPPGALGRGQKVKYH